MIFNNHDNSLTVCRGDYGVPVIFSAGKDEGFSIGDKIIFVFSTKSIANKIFTVNSNDFSFPLSIDKTEAEAICAKAISSVRYSAKRFSEEGEFLETLLDGYLFVKGSLIWRS